MCGSNPNMTGILEKRRLGHRHTEERICEDARRCGHLHAEERGFRENNPASTLALDFQPSERRKSVSVVQAT